MGSVDPLNPLRLIVTPLKPFLPFCNIDSCPGAVIFLPLPRRSSLHTNLDSTVDFDFDSMALFIHLPWDAPSLSEIEAVDDRASALVRETRTRTHLPKVRFGLPLFVMVVLMLKRPGKGFQYPPRPLQFELVVYR